jgi:hypothetical protein
VNPPRSAGSLAAALLAESQMATIRWRAAYNELESAEETGDLRSTDADLQIESDLEMPDPINPRHRCRGDLKRSAVVGFATLPTVGGGWLDWI